MADGLADDPRRPAATDLSTDPVADQMTSSDSICVAISNVLVAAGDGEHVDDPPGPLEEEVVDQQRRAGAVSGGADTASAADRLLVCTARTHAVREHANVRDRACHVTADGPDFHGGPGC